MALVVVIRGLSYPSACGIFLDQRWNLPALAGGVPASGPPGKYYTFYF